MGMSNNTQVKTAVKRSSSALANVFRMEFIDRKKKLVTIPIAALFTITNNT